jgi:hypothetical protein
MATRDEILSAVQIVREFAGDPTVGVVAELLKDLVASTEEEVTTKKTSASTKEVRVADIEETR